jgi:hypothetical protein
LRRRVACRSFAARNVLAVHPTGRSAAFLAGWRISVRRIASYADCDQAWRGVS